MINSMTGFGRAEWKNNDWQIIIELRSFNQRGLKVTLRIPDALKKHEPELESLVGEKISRGHVFCAITCQPSEDVPDISVDGEKLNAYLKIIQELRQRTGTTVETDPVALLALPNVLRKDVLDETAMEPNWPQIKEAAVQAVAELQAMRAREGGNLAAEFQSICEQIDAVTRQILERAPEVVDQYRRRLLARTKQLLEGSSVEITEDSLHREIALFAERADITEEIARIRSHVEQFLEAVSAAQPSGRKLEFLAQEMYREANTIAAKANDSAIVHKAVDLKSEIDRLREQTLNVE